MDNGWIKLHRKITNWEWYDNIKTFKVFMHLLLTSNHSDKKWRGNLVKKGQKITSYQHLADETKMGVQSVRTSLNKLKSTGELTIKSTSKFTIITIANWDNYQIITDKLTSTLTNQQQTTNKQLTTNKNVKNEKNEKKRSFAPPSLDEIKSYCIERNNQLNVEQFHDFYASKGWMVGKNKMKDWRACVRTWENREKQNTSSTEDINQVTRKKYGLD